MIKALRINKAAPLTTLVLLLSGFCSQSIATASNDVKLQQEINSLKKQLNRLESKLSAPAPQRRVDHVVVPTSPDKKLHLNGITITPGGFFAGEGVWRSRNLQSDIGSSFIGIPLGTSPLYYMSEARLSGRQSRISFLVEGQVNPATLLSGYTEADFLGNGSGNSNESNSFDLRIRAFYAHLDQTDWGFHLLAGQNWSLATTNARNFKGATPRGEIIPPTIDAQYITGFVWKRQPQFRFTKDFGEQVWAAVSIENPQTTFGPFPAAGTIAVPAYNNVIQITNVFPGQGTLPPSNFSINHVPDVIGKIAFEPTIYGHKVHVEGVGLYRQFYDQVQYTNLYNVNIETEGWGFGGGGIVEVLPSVLDVQANVLAGHGIGSYASGQLPDVTYDYRGALVGIPEVVFSAGANFHATKALDIYVFGGAEREKSRFFMATSGTRIGQFFGYGTPTANNSGCWINNFGANCTANARKLWQINVGLWDKLYSGAYGELRGGLQYSYTVKELFRGLGTPAVGTTSTSVFLPAGLGYRTNDSMIFASLRYYPFAGEAPKIEGK